eukprot:m.304961 g.304961  ORF g.304961 m.304961 type:complete len:101 (+) comp16443_c7_seq2:203-505(+)
MLRTGKLTNFFSKNYWYQTSLVTVRELEKQIHVLHVHWDVCTQCMLAVRVCSLSAPSKQSVLEKANSMIKLIKIHEPVEGRQILILFLSKVNTNEAAPIV